MCSGFLTDWIFEDIWLAGLFKTQCLKFNGGADFAFFKAGTKVLSFTQKSKFFAAVFSLFLYDFRHSSKRQKSKKVTVKSKHLITQWQFPAGGLSNMAGFQ